MGRGKVPRDTVSFVLLTVIGVIMLAGILTGVLVAPSAISDGADGIMRAGIEVSSLPTHLQDGMWKASPTADERPGAAIIGRAIAYAITAFFEIVG